jgi:hypothetical protein
MLERNLLEISYKRSNGTENTDGSMSIIKKTVKDTSDRGPQ